MELKRYQLTDWAASHKMGGAVEAYGRQRIHAEQGFYPHPPPPTPPPGFTSS